MENTATPVFSHVEPIFPVRDVSETIRYWQEVLCFPHHWTWGDPPEIGGVSWQKAFVQFLRNPGLAAASKGNAIWVRLHHVEALYAIHRESHAEIVAPLELHAYGMAQYTVRELNGYYVHFAGNPMGRGAEHPEEGAAGHSGGAVSHSGGGENEGTGRRDLASIRIVERKPTLTEYLGVQGSGEEGDGQGASGERLEANIISTATVAVVAEEIMSGEVIGCAFLLSDHAGFYYVKNVIVRPDWRGRRVGTALMKELMQWLEKNANRPALVGLFAREALEPFYQQFGFLSSFGMVKEL